ncbi:PAS domain S-box protein [Methyloceanibacter caenitepidi]|nr:PAS domain S-box protein [Methyloceanibacter caenitepidi]
MAIWASVFGSVTALGVAALMYMTSSSAVKQMEALATSEALERASVRLGASLDRLKQDTTILSTMPPIQGLIRTRESGGIDPLDDSTEVLWGNRLAHIFTSFLEARPEYFQIRFVSATDDGIEIVRVEKTEDGIQRTPESKLQRKAERPYFRRTLELRPGERFLSDVNLNREYGELEVPHRPTVRAATPVFDDKTGEVFGMIVINADAQDYFRRMAAVLQRGQRLVVANADGDYLYHPDPALSFGFDLGERHLIQDAYPGLGDIDPDTESVVVGADGKSQLHQKRIVIDGDRPDRFLTLGVIEAESGLERQIGADTIRVILTAVAFILGGTALAVFWSRYMTRPLKEVTAAAVSLRRGRRDVDLSGVRERNDETGDLARAFGAMADEISDRELALREQSKALIESNERLSDLNTQLSAVMQTAPDGLIVIDEAGIVQSFNPAAERMFGYSKDEVIGQNVRILMPEPYRREHDGYIRNYLDTGEGQIIGAGREVHALRKDGTTFPIELGVSPMQVGDKQLFLGMTSDISRKKAIERQREERFIARLKRSNEELALARTEAEAATIAKSEFLANMTHELRTPLNIIVGFAGLLAKSKGLRDEDRRFANTIDSSSRALLALVNDILDFSSLEADAAQLHPVPFSMVRLVEEVAASVSLMAEEKNLTVKIERGNAVGEAHFGDPGRLHQVLLNLVNNAVKFTDKGTVTIALSAAEHSDSVQHLRIEVRDTGIGIDPERVETIFNRFTQANSSIHGRYGGTGLGLAISYRLVEMMGGKMGVESVEGKGTTVWFEITLPCMAAQALADDDRADEPQRSSSAARVLVVDDVDLNRDLVSALLEPEGYVISEAAGGAQAIEAVKTGNYDMVLMDVQMPDVDGLQATRTIRAMRGFEHLPIIAMTAQALASQWEKCREAGMSDHLPKPITPATLRAMMSKWAEGAKRVGGDSSSLLKTGR